MKRESNLIQKLLVKLEAWPAQPGDMFLFNGTEPELATEGYTSDQIEYHLTLLKSEGYIDSPGSQPTRGVTFRSLTPRGHDVVDQYRETNAAEEKQKWISAAEAASLLTSAFNSQQLAQVTICKRAHGGLIHARAERFMVDGVEHVLMDEFGDIQNIDIEKEFWWAEGNAALHQNWVTGDFDTWVEGDESHLQAFGVSFLRSDIEELIPAGTAQPILSPPPSPAAGGRPPAAWWEDLLIEICFQHFRGDLKPKVQADIERAMENWIAQHSYEAAPSTVRARARKVWQAIKSESEK